MEININKEDDEELTIAEVILMLGTELIFFGFVGFVLFLIVNLFR